MIFFQIGDCTNYNAFAIISFCNTALWGLIFFYLSGNGPECFCKMSTLIGIYINFYYFFCSLIGEGKTPLFIKYNTDSSFCFVFLKKE